MRKGFTLVEILVVITIIGLLATIVLVSLNIAKEKAKKTGGLQFDANIYHGLGAYALGVWDFNEGAGTLINDLSGGDNNGTSYNNPVWRCASSNKENTASGMGCALEFDGSNDYVKVDNNLVDNPASLTISAWFKKTGNGSTYECVLHSSSDTSIGNSEYWLGADIDDYLTATIGARAGVGWAAGKTNIKAVLDTWYHLAASWDGSVVKVYVDGNYIKQYNLTSYSNLTTPTRFGASSDGSSYQFRGYIDDIRIYEKSLTESQIKQFYAEGLKRHSLVNK